MSPRHCRNPVAAVYYTVVGIITTILFAEQPLVYTYTYYTCDPPTHAQQ